MASRSRRLPWPELPYPARQHLFDVLDLSLADVRGEHREDGAGHRLRIDIVRQLQGDAGQETLETALAHRLARRIPAFVVEAADQHRKLGSELGDLVDGEAVAERVQGRAQPDVRVAPRAAQARHQLAQPPVGLVDRRVEYVQTCETHRATHLRPRCTVWAGESVRESGTGARLAYLTRYVKRHTSRPYGPAPCVSPGRSNATMLAGSAMRRDRRRTLGAAGERQRDGGRRGERAWGH